MFEAGDATAARDDYLPAGAFAAAASSMHQQCVQTNMLCTHFLGYDHCCHHGWLLADGSMIVLYSAHFMTAAAKRCTYAHTDCQV